MSARLVARSLLASVIVAVAVWSVWEASLHLRSTLSLERARNDIGIARVGNALRTLDRAVSLTPAFADVHEEHGRVELIRFRRFGDEAAGSRSVAAYRQAVERVVLDGAAFADLGWALSYTGDHDAAIQAFQKGLERDPFNRYILASLGRAYQAAGRVGEALDAFRRAQAVRPSSDLRDLMDALENP